MAEPPTHDDITTTSTAPGQLQLPGLLDQLRPRPPPAVLLRQLPQDRLEPAAGSRRQHPAAAASTGPAARHHRLLVPQLRGPLLRPAVVPRLQPALHPHRPRRALPALRRTRRRHRPPPPPGGPSRLTSPPPRVGTFSEQPWGLSASALIGVDHVPGGQARPLQLLHRLTPHGVRIDGQGDRVVQQLHPACRRAPRDHGRRPPPPTPRPPTPGSARRCGGPLSSGSRSLRRRRRPSLPAQCD